MIEVIFNGYPFKSDEFTKKLKIHKGTSPSDFISQSCHLWLKVVIKKSVMVEYIFEAHFVFKLPGVVFQKCPLPTLLHFENFEGVPASSEFLMKNIMITRFVSESYAIQYCLAI